MKNGRTVEYTPIEDNPYHSDIVLPGLSRDGTIDLQIQRDHAHELAKLAV